MSALTGRRGLGSTPVLATVLCVSWALMFVVQRVALEESGPMWVVAGRVGVAAVVLLPLAGSLRTLSRRGLATGATLAVTNQILFLNGQVAGLEQVGAGAAAAIIYVQPVLVVVAAHFALGEPLTGRRLAAALLGLAGVVVIGAREFALGSGAAALLLVGAAVSWAVGTLLTRRSAEPVLPLVVAQHVFAAPLLLVQAAVLEPVPALSAAVVLPVLYAGAIGSALGWYLQAVLLRRGEAGVVSAWLFAVPVLAALLGAALLGEPLTPHLLAGVVLVGSAIRLITAPVTAKGRPR